MANTQLHFLLVSVGILVTQTTNGAYGVITSAPLNRVVYEGATNTKITCASNDASVDWILYPFAFTAVSDMVFPTTKGELNPSFKESFAIDHSQGTEVYTLIVSNATISPSDRADFSTAGIYSCGKPGRVFYAHLVVIRSDPICSSNFTQSTAMLQPGNAMQLSCKIVYGSTRNRSIDAVMTWSVNGQPIPVGKTTFTLISSPTETTASLTLVINENFDAAYECGTTFSQPLISIQGVASNAPDYFKTCTISRVKTLTPLNRVVYEGDTNVVISCQSNKTLVDWLMLPFAYSGATDDFNVLTRHGKIDFHFNKSFAIDRSQGKDVYSLVVFKATIYPGDRATYSTAGLYLCYYSGASTQVAAQLIVIRTDPICSSNFTQSTAVLKSGDVIQLSCTIVYGSYREYPIDAVMTWSMNGQPIPNNNVDFTVNSTPTEITASSTLVISDNFDAIYECGTTFSQPGNSPPQGFANNAPDYFKTCTISR